MNKITLVASAALMTFSVLGVANAADVPVASSAVIPAHGIKTAGDMGFFVYPNEDLEFVYNKVDASFMPANPGGTSFNAKLINDDSTAATGFKIEAKTQYINSRMMSNNSPSKGVMLVPTIGGVELTDTYQSLDLAEMGMVGAGTVTGVQEYSTIPASVLTGAAIGESAQSDLPPGEYRGQVSIDFLATWTMP